MTTTTASSITPIQKIYTAARLEYYRAEGKAVFIDLTADWRLTCKVNEKVALTETIQAQFAQHEIAGLVGDWTNQNPEVSQLLKQRNRRDIPLYLMYPKGVGEPEVLPQILTERMLKMQFNVQRDSKPHGISDA